MPAVSWYRWTAAGSAFSLSLCALSAQAGARSAEIFLCTAPQTGAPGVETRACFGAGTLPEPETGIEPLVTFGRAADLAGRPLTLVRIIAPSAGRASALGAVRLPGMIAPVNAYALTSSFGLRQHPLLGGLRAHTGVDLAAPTGSPIFATSDGVVSMADWRGGYGLFVALDHGQGVQTRYGHLSRLAVSSGQQVRKGDLIGLVGSTGRSTGPHLHYEVRLNGQAVNPAPYLKRR